MKKPDVITLNKPIPVGFAILELSKLFMFKSYDKFRQQFGTKNLKLCFSDTDSFLFQVKCGNLIQKLKEMDHMFDFSKYDKNQVLYTTTPELIICFILKMKWKVSRPLLILSD